MIRGKVGEQTAHQSDNCVYEVVERGEGQVNATHRPSRTLPKLVKSRVPEIGCQMFSQTAKLNVSKFGYVDCF